MSHIPVNAPDRSTPALNADLAASSTTGPPRFEFDAVATRALAMVLQADPLPKLVSACAPPGYGKTVLLSRLHQECLARRHCCLWVTLDDGDTDLSSLIYRIRTALLDLQDAQFVDTFGPTTLFRDRSSSADGILNLLAQLPTPATLFIDNLGFCADAALNTFLERLLFGTPPDLRLVLSSTREIPVDTVRAKLELGAMELGASQLSFDRISAARLFQQAGLNHATEADIERVLTQTEGWPAAMRLLQVLLKDRQAHGSPEPDIGQTLQRFGGDHSDIARVLTRRVLVGFDPALVQFMVEISLLREFSADLAAHMTGRPEAKEWLDLLLTRNVLIFPLGHNRRWFRFHTLLREFLQAESQECISVARRKEILGRAARWHIEQGDDMSAISLSLEAGATELAQDLLDRIAHVVAGDHGQMSKLIHWVENLQSVGGNLSAEVQVWFVWALCDSHQYERANRALDEFDRQLETGQPVTVSAGTTPSRLLFARSLVNVWVDRLDTAYEQSKAWLERGEVPDAMTRATALGIAGMAETDQGELQRARVSLAQASASILRSDSTYGSSWIAVLRACMEIGHARPDVADELLSSMHEEASKVIGENADLVVTIDFVRARALLDLGRYELAEKLAQEGLERAMHHGVIASLEQGLIANVAFWHNDASDANNSQRLERVAHAYPARGYALLVASQIRRLLQLGRPTEAKLMADRIGLATHAHRNDTSLKMRERGDWLLARLELLMAQGAAEELLNLIDPLLKTARLQERHRDRIELLLLAAEAHQRLGHLRMAVRSISLAVVLASPGNLIHPFKVRQHSIALVMSETSNKDFGLTRDSEWAFFERLRWADTRANGTMPERDLTAEDDNAMVTHGVPTLREIQLLALIDQGLNNEQVADRLSLSVPTVKWHLHNIYVKLGVRNRSSAVARARTLNLIGRELHQGRSR